MLLALTQRPRVLVHGLKSHVKQPAPVNSQSAHVEEIVGGGVSCRSAHVLEELRSQREWQQKWRAIYDCSADGRSARFGNHMERCIGVAKAGSSPNSKIQVAISWGAVLW